MELPAVLCLSPSQNGFAESFTGMAGAGEPKRLVVELRLRVPSPEGAVREKVGTGKGAGAFDLTGPTAGELKVREGVFISRGLLKAAERAKKFGTLVGFSDG